MGFFSKIFKKKKGGTFFGNLLRKATGKSTDNVNPNVKETDKQRYRREEPKWTDDIIKGLGDSVVNTVGKQLQPTAKSVIESKEVKEIQKDMLKDWLKKKWYYIAIPVTIIIGVVIYVTKVKKSR